MADKFIDVEGVIKQKNPRLLNYLPRFILRYLKRIIHQDEVNEIIASNSDVDGVEFCHNVVEHFNIDVVVEGIENIPQHGGVMVASNHPLGGMDALALVYKFAERRSDIKFVANDILLNLEPLKNIFVGVNKHGSNASSSLRALDETMASDQVVVVFPAGLVSRKRGGQIRDLEWKKTFVTRARKHNTPIVPVYIQGGLSNFFYRLSNLREFLGIKANLEMLYLVDELFKQKNTSMRIVVGEPILAADLSDGKKDIEWAQIIKNKVYELGK